MDRVAEVECAEAAVPARRFRRTHPDHALDVVAIGAALERRERGEREPAHSMQRRRRDRNELGQTRRERGRLSVAAAGEQRELLDFFWFGLRRRDLRTEAIEADEHACAATLQLDRFAAHV